MTEADREWDAIVKNEICKNCMYYKKRQNGKAMKCKKGVRIRTSCKPACKDFDQLLMNYVVNLDYL